MKDYSYFIPGYTGFCPELKDHYGETYGHATRHILQMKPHLKERLAPVHYRYRRFERTKGTLGKYFDQERNKYDYPKSKCRKIIHDANKAEHRTDYDIGDTRKRTSHLEYEDDDMYSEKCCGDCENVHPSRLKYATYADGDKIRKNGHECVCPKYVFIKGFAECVQPKIWTSEVRQKFPLQHYPCIATPCAHVREYSEHCIPDKRYSVPLHPIHRKECHPVDCGHTKDANVGTDRRMKKGQRVRPHRYGGVIPKYTGHVPGMQFSFGESYGPVSDRLLRKHHDRMKELKIKS